MSPYITTFQCRGESEATGVGATGPCAGTEVPQLLVLLFHPQLHDVEFCCSLSQLVEHAVPALLELKAAGKAADSTTAGHNDTNFTLLVTKKVNLNDKHLPGSWFKFPMARVLLACCRFAT